MGLPPKYAPPFPWFGGKSRIAARVWSLLGNPPNYIEPFFGAGAVYFLRPHPHQLATLNDKDGFVANFWRATQADPAAAARWADNPVFENDLHARHAWLVEHSAELRARLEGSPDYFDPKIAGWWAWGVSCWIGGGFCSGQGPWRVVEGKLIKTETAGQGVNRQLVHLGDAGRGVNRKRAHLQAYFADLAERLAPARVCCGDWQRVCGPTPTIKNGVTGVFLDPPYALSQRDKDLYRVEATETLGTAVQTWALSNGGNPWLRIVLAGLEGEYPDLTDAGWRVIAWKADGGYSRQNRKKPNLNRTLERLWVSPHCLSGEDDGLA